ncbi:MAG: GNAT family N-acetyltransferase [Flavobacteriales bacterium]|nr:GNAT family N-acetyltransferase [Flavobacteriales bacterium]
MLDRDLAVRNGDANDFFAQFNGIEHIRYAVVVCDEQDPVGCGAFKAFEEDAVEIKRMYTVPTHRKRGVASRVLLELELWAKEEGHTRCVLETGVQQPEALGLYRKRGYEAIPNYGQYIGVESSRCFEKMIS